jgi:hypothetical protein
VNVLILLGVIRPLVAIVDFLSEFRNLVFKLLNLIALQVDKLEHLEVFLLILAKYSQEFLKVLDLGGSLDLGKVLSELLYLFHLF